MTDDIYRDEIMDHYKNPKNHGKTEEADVEVRETNASCGDEIEITIKKGLGQKGKNKEQSIKEIKFRGQGCVVSMAFTSILIEKVLDKQMSIGELKEMKEDEMVKMIGGVGVSAGRQKCLRLGIRALKKAVANI